MKKKIIQEIIYGNLNKNVIEKILYSAELLNDKINEIKSAREVIRRSESLLDMENDVNKFFVNFLKEKFFSFYGEKKKDVELAKTLLKRKIAAEILELRNIYGDEMEIYDGGYDGMILSACYCALFNFKNYNTLYSDFIKEKKIIEAIKLFFEKKDYKITYDELDGEIENLRNKFKKQTRELKIRLWFLLRLIIKKFFLAMENESKKKQKLNSNANENSNFKTNYLIFQKIKRMTDEATRAMEIAIDESVLEMLSKEQDPIYLETIKTEIEKNSKFRLNFLSKLFFIAKEISRLGFLSGKIKSQSEHENDNSDFIDNWFIDSKIFLISVIIFDLMKRLSDELIKNFIIRVKENLKPSSEKILTKLNYYLIKLNY